MAVQTFTETLSLLAPSAPPGPTPEPLILPTSLPVAATLSGTVNPDSNCFLTGKLRQLLYWPTPVSDGQPTTVVSNSFTFTVPSPYLVLEEVYAAITTTTCPDKSTTTTYIGSSISQTTVAIDPAGLSSWNWINTASGHVTGYFMPFTVSDVTDCPQPTGWNASALVKASEGAPTLTLDPGLNPGLYPAAGTAPYSPTIVTRTATGSGGQPTTIINDPCRAWVAWPAEVENLGNFWWECKHDLGLLDPPKSITGVGWNLLPNPKKPKPDKESKETSTKAPWLFNPGGPFPFLHLPASTSKDKYPKNAEKG